MKKNYILRVVIVIFLFLIVGCVRNDATSIPDELTATTGISTSTPFSAIAVPDSQTKTPMHEQAISPIQTVYAFDAVLDYNKHTLQVMETIQYQNQTGEDLHRLILTVPPNHKAGIFQAHRINLKGGAELKEHSLEGVVWTLDLNTPLPVGKGVAIEIEYQLDIPPNGGVLGYTPLQLNVSDWYPFVPPYDPQTGWVIHAPAEVGEYLVYDMADFHLTLAGTEGLQVTASTWVVPNLVNVKMDARNVRNLTFSISEQYKVLSARSGPTVIYAYVFPGDEVSGQAALDNTKLALEYFSEIFGFPYPHETMTLVEADFADGMEYDGFYYLSRDYFARYDDGVTNYLSLLSVHETTHQWWYALVANDQALEPWLDEALATYSEYLYIEHYYPELRNWWWEYRVDTYNPSGKANLTIYEQDEVRPYINSVYLQGASFLHKLRSLQGDETFFSGLRSYVDSKNSQLANWAGFLEIMIPIPSEETTALLKEYFEENESRIENRE